MTPKQEQAMRDLDYNRKASDWADINAEVRAADVAAILGSNWHDELPAYDEQIYPDATDPHPLRDFAPAYERMDPCVFLLRLKDHGVFVVNTEGYSYCRYAARFIEEAKP